MTNETAKNKDTPALNDITSVIIPTYRERDNIKPLVERLARVLRDYEYEIVVVDDDSGDGTAEIASELAQEYPVRVLVRKNKKGLATAVVDGMADARGDIIAVMDADLQHPPEILPGLIRTISEDKDLAIASRYVPGGGCQGWSTLRKIMSKGAILLAHILLPKTRGCRDPVSGFFVFRRRCLDDVAMQPTGFKILLEILATGNFASVAEIPYTFVTRERGKSKLNISQQLIYVKHLINLMRRTGELRRFLKFCLVGLSGVLVNMGLLWFLTELVGLYYLVSAAISIETAIISNFILNDIFTFRDRHQGGGLFCRRLLRFNLVSLAGLGINMGILWILTDILGVFYLVSNLLGIAAATLWNYSVNTWWTWK